jgi:3-hydroxybutyryl-CoA dehydrogenase
MEAENIRVTAVVGAGIMGTQVAEILSRVGKYMVYMTDINEELARKGYENIENRLEQFFVSKKKLSPAGKREVLSRIEVKLDITEAVGNADFVIEAITENLALKKDVFRKIDEYAPQHAVLASNTSYQSISEIGSATRRPNKVIGTHFFNPVAVLKLVEIVRGSHTTEESVALACGLARKLGKEPVICRDTSYRFLANRAYLPMMEEAIQMVWERVAPPEDIDKAVKLGYNLPMGPLEIMDLTGAWKVFLSSEEDSIREVGPQKGRVHSLVRIMDRAGYYNIYEFWKDVMSKW